MIADVKKFILFDNDGVLVDTEPLYYAAGERALAEVGVTLDKEQYLLDMAHGRGVALRRYGAHAHEALVVEDSSRGLRSAVAAGIDCVVVENAFTTSQDFSQATHRIRSLAELRGLVLGST